MAHSKLKHHYQAALDCDLCESHDKVEWYCITCPANLCEKCKVLHTSRKNFKQHCVISREEYKSKTKKENENEKTVVSYCAVHRNNELTLTCVTCKVPVCSECIVSKHNQHKFESLTSKLDKTKKNLSIYISKLEEKTTQVLRLIDKNTEGLTIAQGKKEEVRMDIIKARDNVKALADAESKKMLEQLETEMKKNTFEVSKSNTKLKSSHQQMTNLIQKARPLLNNHDTDTIDEFLSRNHFDEEFPDGEVKLATPKFQDRSLQSIGILGTLNFECVKEKEVVACSLKPSDIKIIGTFTIDATATEIRTASSTLVWCSNFDKTCLRLYQFRGKGVKSLTTDFKVQSFILDGIGNVIACDLNGQSIKKITTDGSIVILCNTKPQSPRGICLNQRKQAVVCMGEFLVIFSHDFKTKLHEFRYDQQGQPLFQRAFKVAVNGNTSYCAVDVDAKRVVTISMEGRLLWTYNGGQLKDKFSPTNICCDTLNMVIVADTANHKVHLLANTGDFIMYITSGIDIKDPCGLDISDDGLLWISENSKSRKVHRVKYLSDIQ
ncbi:hypothetical protein FSP39_011430 [Pinctada imbricata]|uniref:B box-type domain-containing protein n=1 Tax=Pinctada imbricata TaxID=66713 RepID=A0AA88YJE5_PINIB|nr:hypothetical protein FSP39_011430 [Pinctada imbricata]